VVGRAKLRPYQRQAINAAFREWKRGRRSTLFVCPTGGGKSLTFSRTAERFRPQGRTLVLADREWLVTQARDNVEKHTQLRVGIEMAEHRVRRDALPDVVCASVQTLHRRIGDFGPDAFGLIVVDEADLAMAPTYRKILDYFTSAKILGVTATPDRADGQGLGELFETVCHSVEIGDLIRDGHLAPIRQRVVKVLDLSLAKVQGGDFTDASLERILTEERHLHEVAKPTLELSKERQTLVFATSVKHAAALADVFNRYKPGSARHVHGGMDSEERRDVIDPFLRGEFQILVNCALLLRGVDLPPVACIAMARPTQSRALYAQALGRGTRLHPGKTDCLVLDFGDNASQHSLVTALDFLGGKHKPEVVERARELLDEQGDGDVLNTLDEAERQVEADPALRERVLAMVKYRTRVVAQTGPKGIDWDSQPLGQISDAQLAKRIGISRAVVSAQRQKRGIPAFVARPRPQVDWNNIDLAGRSTTQLAKDLGVSRWSVERARDSMGVPTPFPKMPPAPKATTPKLNPTHKGIQWDEQPLGQVTDRELASRNGVTEKTVRTARRSRGIPAFQSSSK
jgi:superfamily II DNA or RNA helicase